MAGQQEIKPYQQQLYDSTLKSLLQDQANEILNFLIGDVTFIQALDGEAIKPAALRTDRFYQILQSGKIKIAHIELETASDGELPYRMLEYFAILYKHHRKAIIPIVIYPFQTKLPESPLIIRDEDDEILIFHYRLLRCGHIKLKSMWTNILSVSTPFYQPWQEPITRSLQRRSMR